MKFFRLYGGADGQSHFEPLASDAKSAFFNTTQPATGLLLRNDFAPHIVNEVWIPYWTLGDYFVDISKTLDLKLAALKKHRSQVAKPGQEWDVDKWVRKRHRDIGKKGGYQYAESFKRIKV